MTVTQPTLSKHIHTTILWPFFRDHLGEPVPEEIFRTNQRPTSIIPIFMPHALPAATLPLYSGLEQAANMPACIPSGTFQQYQSTDPNQPQSGSPMPVPWSVTLVSL